MPSNHWDKVDFFFTENELERLKGISDLFLKALAIIGRVYAERLDKSGNAELGHFIRVSDQFESLDEKVTGLLHDIVEDKMITFEDLIRVGIPMHIIEALKILTRDKSVFPNYADYITSILDSNNELAIQIKYADMLDNSSEQRLNLLDESVKIRLAAKYKNQLPRLEMKINEMNNNLVRERKCV